MTSVFARSLLLMTLLTLCYFTIHAQQPEWVRGGGTASDPAHPEASYSICTDINGNIYSLNEVGTGTVHADSFSATLSSSGAQNILVTSYSCDGQMRWAKAISSSSYNGFVPYTIKADNSGHIYVAANLSRFGSLQIGSDTTITGLTNEVQALIQFDTSGHFNWIRFVGDNTSSSTSISGEFYSFLAVDGNNIVHYFNGLNAGVHITPSLTSLTGTYDISYDQSGTLLRAKRLDLDSSLDMYGAAIDRSTNKIYGFGLRKYSATVTGGGDSSNYAFVAAFDTGDNRIWIDTAGSTLFQNPYFCGVDVDNHGHIYYAIFSTIDVIYRGDTLYPYPGAGSVELFSIMKMDTAANLLWTSMVSVSGASSSGTYNSMSLLPTNKIALTAGFEGTISDGTTSCNSPDYKLDPFLYITDTGGHPVALKQLHGDGHWDIGYCITSDIKGNIYMGGQVEDSIPTSLVPEYHSVGGPTDFFIFKYGIPCDCPAFPVASFIHTGYPTVNFAYTGTTAGIDSVRWHFGDGGTSTAFSPTHTYTTAGAYSATVTIYSPCGGDVFYDSVIVPCAGIPVAGYTDTGLSPVKHFAYTGATYGLDSVVWHFGDGGHATGLTPVHTYTAIGTYAACVIAYNPCGVDSVCHTVNIPCLTAPVASFYDTGTYAIGFFYNGTTAGLDSVVWNYGDAHTGTGTIAHHTYAAPGTYNVCVTVYTACGSNTVCHTLVIACTATPIASFTSTGLSTINVTYTGTTAYLDSVVWTFGDGGHSTGLTATHSYAIPDTYHICVTVYTACGVDSSCTDDIIPCIITPSFSDTGIVIKGFTYTGSTTGLDSVVWHYGDGTSGAGLTTTHGYAHSGTFHVCEYTYTNCGVDSICSDISVIGVGINDPANSFGVVSVFPNPTTQELNITGLDDAAYYRVLNVTGSIIASGVFLNGINTLSLKDYMPGVYVLELTGKDGQKQNFRVVKE